MIRILKYAYISFTDKMVLSNRVYATSDKKKQVPVFFVSITEHFDKVKGAFRCYRCDLFLKNPIYSKAAKIK